VAECGTRNAEYRSQESGVRSQESGVRSQESGVRSQESGVRSQERRGQDIGSDGCVCPDRTVGLSPGFQPWEIDFPSDSPLKGRQIELHQPAAATLPLGLMLLRDLKISADPVALAHYKTQ
jgi:hypothetical protein